ncbi:hypothetical protein Fuma_00598 [Fuerstiella marisgermanici]|uniref:Uncharacterized protein n=1 Tax=Fuerstiella marisgermanici TaxID=1891926 RepID=A0A1P8WAF3_9PLAN|nr:hypothetical protein Fuma_00598 [Fuerstiella marisgermanici]
MAENPFYAPAGWQDESSFRDDSRERRDWSEVVLRTCIAVVLGVFCVGLLVLGVVAFLE